MGTVLVIGWPKARLSQDGGCLGDLRVEHDVEVGIAQRGQLRRRAVERCDDVYVDTKIVRAVW
jgi:hypothetical protein